MKSAIFLILSVLTVSCATAEEGDDQQEVTDFRALDPNTEIVVELSEEQQAAFDALNTLQQSTDELSRLYSTFADIEQPFYPADTFFVISQSELLVFMKQFVSKHCQNLAPEIRDELAATSVLAQEEYNVLYCSYNPADETYENGIPMMGVWVMPNVLGLRDVLLVW